MIAALKAWWSRFVARHIVADEPEDACSSCREPYCDESQEAECKLRGPQGLRVGKRAGRPTKVVWKEE